jgi:hypothetical protein
MAYVIRNQAVIDKEGIDELFKDVSGLVKLAGRGGEQNFLSLAAYDRDMPAGFADSEMGYGAKSVKACFSSHKLLRSAEPAEHDYLIKTGKKKFLLGSPVSKPLKGKAGHFAKKRYAGILSKKGESEIEEIIAEKWRYLVMSFGGEFLTEIRPDKCFIHNERLSDNLVLYHDDKFSLNTRILEEYLKRNNGNGLVQVHLTDIMLNPKTKEHDIFSITSGNTEKARIYLDLAEFLDCYNKGKDAVIPLHLPYYESWKTANGVRSFGSLGENGKRDACFLAEKTLRYLEQNWKRKNIKLALENGFGECKINSNIIYALIHEPYNLKFLKQGREGFVTFCEDVGHLNLVENVDWTEYLAEKISEFHVSGNNGKEDVHMVATPATLKNYKYIMSFLKFFPGNICAEMKRGELTIEDFVDGVKGLVTTLFTKPSDSDYINLSRIENKMRKRDEKINKENLNTARYREYRKAVAVSA